MRTRKVFVPICRVSICVCIVTMYISVLSTVVIIFIVCMFVNNNSIFGMLLHYI